MDWPIIIGGVVFFVALVYWRFNSGRTSDQLPPIPAKPLAVKNTEKKNATDGVFKTAKATFTININGNEKKIELGGGIPEVIVRLLAAKANITPDEARQLLAGPLDEETLKKILPHAELKEFKIKKDINWKIGDKQ